MILDIFRKRESYLIYLNVIVVLGITTLIWSIFIAFQIENIPTFLFIAVLAAVSQVTTTTIKSGSGSITYAIAPAISLAAIPFWGPAGAILIDAASSIIVWMIKPAEKGVWKKSWRQLAFNTAMSSLALLGAGFVFKQTQILFGSSVILGMTIPWVLAAITLDQINLWLLIGILRLQQGPKLDVLEMWRTDSWASRMSIAVMTFGGGLLAYAIASNDWVGILAYFLPILLSAYAFRLYVNQMRSHLDNLEQIIETRTQKLKDLMTEKDAFLAVLTHDMKTPLTSIGIYGDILKRRPDILTKKPKMAEIILRSQKELLDIVNNILDLEKLNVDGSIPIDKEQYDLVAATESIIESLGPMAEKKQIDLTFCPKNSAVLIQADRFQISRVTQNLVSNALKYTGDGGKVTVNLYTSESRAVIEVSDNGFGIPEEDLPYIFNRFRRVEKHRRRAVGTGLGLAIAKALVESHEGHITVESQENIGSTFRIALPLE